MKSFKGMRRMWARVVREGHLEEGTFKGSFKNGVALARARQGGWKSMKGGVFRQFSQWLWTLRE